MLVLRCTRRLLHRLGDLASPVDAQSTTVLGDWYATILHVRPVQLVLLVNEPTRMAVFLPARPLKTLTKRVPQAIGQTLLDIGVDPTRVGVEWAHMNSVAVTSTRSRSVVGTMNQIISDFEWRVEPGTEIDLRALNFEMARWITWLGSQAYPGEAARRLLVAANVVPPDDSNA